MRSKGTEIRTWLPKPQAATLIVAASDSLYKERADAICDGVADNVEIQAVLDALPATGGEVKLLDGTYQLAAAIVMDSYQTLKGCGRNTILRGVSGRDMVTATGGAGTEKQGLLITTICFDGDDTNNDRGIEWTYVDNSKIVDCWFIDNGDNHIYLTTSDRNLISGNYIEGGWFDAIHLIDDCSYNRIANNHVNHSGGVGIWCQTNSNYNTIIGNTVENGDIDVGIELYGSCHWNTIVGNTVRLCTLANIYLYSGCEFNTIVGNTVTAAVDNGIEIFQSHYNTITGNTVDAAVDHGINIDGSDFCTIVGNIVAFCGQHGIRLDSAEHCIVEGNDCSSNSQTTDDTYDNIHLLLSDDCSILNNLCRQGVEVNQPRYGINISTTTCDRNRVLGNDLRDAGKTANFNDIGKLTTVRDDNQDITPIQVKHLVYVQNTSGGNRLIGNIVSYEASAGTIGFQDPTAIGDPQVWGMLVENINNNAFGYIQVKGGTIVMDVTNVGGGAIAIGDPLCTEVGRRARKAAAGHVLFAIALEAADLADAILDALIITPRSA